MTTDMRNLIAHAGNRLCTQAQFHWRSVFTQIVQQIRIHGERDGVNGSDAWQYKAIANSAMFRPACYQLGHCPFKASFDRACSIRSKVDRLSQAGVPSSEWEQEIPVGEWLFNPASARKAV